tara:strand:+ start:2411 stop:3172 length:762 start_codon:yes stop_codon:yes gene_type:complete
MSNSSFSDAERVLSEKYHGIGTKDYKKDLDRLGCGEPLAYVIGSIPFLSSIIDLQYRPFIPEPETEFWVQNIITKIQKDSPKDKPIKILDIFAGSGAIGIAMLRELQNANCTFVEKNPKYLEQIKINTDINDVSQRSKILSEQDFQDLDTSFDYVCANPPYIDREKIGNVDASVLNWEPNEALFAEDSGLFYIKRLIDDYKKLLNKYGTLIIEFDSWQKNLIEEYVRSRKISSHSFQKDQYGMWRTIAIQHHA